MSQIDAYRTYWSRIPQTQAHVVGIQRREIVKSDRGKHVATIVEHNQPQTLLDRHRNASLGVNNQLLVSPARHLDVTAVGRRPRAANLHLTLRARPIQRKPAQGVASTSEEGLAE